MLEFFSMISSFIGTILKGLITAFSVLFSSLGNVIFVAGRMPYFISASIFASLFIVVINYLIGRSNR